MPEPQRKTGYQTGLRAEKTAEIMLRLKGWRVLARRYKTPVGEIDLVARRGNMLAFIEVKWRRDTDRAAEAVHLRNQQRVRDAAALYLQEHPQYNHMEMRFDTIVMAPKSWPRHIEAAWE